MVATAEEISRDAAEEKSEMLFEFWTLRFPPGRSSSYILRNTPVRQDSENKLSNCGID